MKETIKKGLVFGLTANITMIIAGISYAVFNDQISEVSSGNPLQASEYNKLVQKLNAIDEKQLATAWVSFDGTNCNTNGNQCDINGEFNVDRVERIATGQFDIYFKNNMSNTGYSVISMNSDQDAHTQLTISYLDDSNPQSTSKFRIHFRDSANPTFRDELKMNVQIFGGK